MCDVRFGAADFQRGNSRSKTCNHFAFHSLLLFLFFSFLFSFCFVFLTPYSSALCLVMLLVNRPFATVQSFNFFFPHIYFFFTSIRICLLLLLLFYLVCVFFLRSYIVQYSINFNSFNRTMMVVISSEMILLK